MTALPIDGKALAAKLRANCAAEVRRLAAEHDLVPGLATLVVGDDPASQAYVANKRTMSTAAGMRSFDHRLPTAASEAEVLALVAKLNEMPSVHGVLVQLPLPDQIDPYKVMAAIHPGKDVDGLHPMNVGRLALGMPTLIPCTPLGCMALIATVHPQLAGVEALVIGRSNIVGKPVARLLMGANATVTVGHSKSRDLPGLCRCADLVIAATGRPELVRGSWIKPGATVIDAGISRIETAGQHRIVGDVAFAEAVEVAGAITPVPGGVGPMTIACLLANTIRAACAATGLPAPAL